MMQCAPEIDGVVEKRHFSKVKVRESETSAFSTFRRHPQMSRIFTGDPKSYKAKCVRMSPQLSSLALSYVNKVQVCLTQMKVEGRLQIPLSYQRGDKRSD